MKCAVLLILAIGQASATQFIAARESPVGQIVTLLGELKTRIEQDGMSEQASYDKYACWCEDTLARKAGDISAGKEKITELDTLIKKLKGEIAVHTAEVADLTKAVAANLKSQKEATEVRDNEKQEYIEERTESEQCIGALEAAVKVLSSGASLTQKKGFLVQEQTQVLSVAAGLRSMLRHAVAKRSFSESDLEAVQHFVESPEDYVASQDSEVPSLSAVQVANNPFGDYAPQSSKIQGILKGMYDSFTASLESANANEAEAQKSFEALMSTKRSEHATLTATLERQTLDEAEKSQTESESQQLRDDTIAQLKADEQFFADAKNGCKVKAGDWATRTRLRTEELNGMIQAISILSAPDAQAIFANSSATFLQVGSVDHENKARDAAFERLKAIARKAGSESLAEIAADLKTGGHFDAVIKACDTMIAILRGEEADDIKHRDRCQANTNANNNAIEDLEHYKEKTEKELERLADEETAKKAKITELENQITATKGDMEELLEMRNKGSGDFVKALKSDTDAIALIEQAIISLSGFYKRNKISLELAQKKEEPTYTENPDKAPETTFSEGSSRKGESSGIVAILSMIKEDMEMEIKTGRSEDASAQREYLQQKASMKKALEAQQTTKAATETELAELQTTIAGQEESKGQHETDLGGQNELKEAINVDCSWVETHFQPRMDKRKTEIAGLEDAKNYLAGVEAGTEVF